MSAFTGRVVCFMVLLMMAIPCLGQDSLSHASKALELLAVMNMEKRLGQAMEIALAAQLKVKPQLKPYEDVLRSFLSKYMSWSNLKDKITLIYMNEFTEGDMKAMLEFYKTDVGRKTLEKLPVLMSKGAELGQQAVQEHLPELNEAIEKRSKELK